MVRPSMPEALTPVMLQSSFAASGAGVAGEKGVDLGETGEGSASWTVGAGRIAGFRADFAASLFSSARFFAVIAQANLR